MIARNAVYQYAINYLTNLHWSVIPIGTDKKPLIAWKTYQSRLASPEELATWWKQYPSANVGIATGEISNVFVLDCDSIAAIERVKALGIPDTLEVKTSRGIHYYFKYPNFRLTNTVDLFGDKSGVDIRGDGGYVVCPPSIHESGHVYYFEADERGVEEAPPWLLAMVRPKEKGSPRGHQSAALPLETTGNVSPRYVEAAVKGEIDAIQEAREGTRNDTLNRAAFNLGTLAGAGAVDAATVGNELYDAASKAGLDEREARATIDSGLRAGQQKPRQLPQPKKRKEQARTDPADTDNALNPTDLGDGQRLVDWYGALFRYIPAQNKYLIWDGTRFAPDDTLAIHRVVQRVPRRLYSEAADIDDPKERQKAIQHAMHCESVAKMESMLKVAKTHEKITVKPGQLDANPWLINTRNGTIDLHTGQRFAHQREDLITRRIEVTHDSRAKCPTWDTFIRRITGNDSDLADFLQRAVGYSLTGQVTEQCLFFLFGTGRNGKTTFLETLLKLLGEYAIRTPTDTLMARDRVAASNDLARIAGRRLVVANETNEGQRLDEAKIKSLTGGDTVTARFLYGEFFDFTPSHKLWLAGNHKPVIRGVDTGIWRRLRLIPFTTTIPDTEIDPFLPDRLVSELPGILNWAIEGCLRWQRDGLGEPKAVHDATLQYRGEMDILATFIEDEIVIEESARVAAQTLFERYKGWADRNGERPFTQKKLGMLLSDRGYIQVRTNKTRQWAGIRLIERLQLK